MNAKLVRDALKTFAICALGAPSIAFTNTAGTAAALGRGAIRTYPVRLTLPPMAGRMSRVQICRVVGSTTVRDTAMRIRSNPVSSC